MRYGLSLLVCFALTCGVYAQCPGGQCRPNNNPFAGIVIAPVKAVAKVVVTAPVAVVTGSCSSCSQSSSCSQGRTGPIRQFVRNVFRR